MFPSSSRTQKQSQRSSWFRQALAQTRELFIDWTVDPLSKKSTRQLSRAERTTSLKIRKYSACKFYE